jgi:hypothetical protein
MSASPIDALVSVEAARDHMALMPKDNKGVFAKVVYKNRKNIDTAVVRLVMLDAWDEAHREVAKSFGGELAFGKALRRVGNTTVQETITCYRGVSCVPGQFEIKPLMLGLSWSTNPGMAAWFGCRHALKYNGVSDITPYVFAAEFDREQIFHVYDNSGRGEDEVLCDYFNGKNLRLFGEDAPIDWGKEPTSDLITQWLALAEREELRIRARNENNRAALGNSAT